MKVVARIAGVPRSTRRLVAAWLIVEVTIWASAWAIGREGLSFPQSPVDVLSNWDGTQYSAIARNGYLTEGAEVRRFALFPLLPAISRLLGGPEHAAMAGILLNQLCLLINILLIGRLVEDKRSAQLSCEPGFWMLVTPVGFFFSVYYTESLFLLFSLLLVIAYRRNWIVWACLAGVLAGLTRPAALCLPTLFLPDMISRLRRGGPWLETLACAAAPLAGLGIYVSYVGWRVGDPLAYVHLQEIWWKHTWTLPFEPLLADLRLLPMKLMGDYRFPPDQWVRLLSSVSILGLTAWGWRKIDPAFLTYLVAGMVFIHSQQPSGANVRYELALFPVFLLLSRLMAGRPRLAWTLASICIAAQIFYFYRYATWLWVA